MKTSINLGVSNQLNNKFSVVTLVKDFYPKNKEISFNEVLALDNHSFKERFTESPIKRTKLKGLQRNSKFLLD